ncbi:MAG: 3-isopropylmalate dehydratase small subunit [Gemmatimonadota bacterium]|jgi:3-isopropylmalate/(R)-2-methylmalate dehydratase small subunit|nr:3-isopropylmalate dehydratase small subunit [Gemmatimonadota bacterium]
MEPIRSFTSRVVLLPIENIDTDQIIPARFLKVTDKAGLGEALFSDWRYNEDGSQKADFVLNHPGSKGANVLFAGDNFGCGSSREHAPWALVGFGFQAVISTFFADIFRNNALKNGLLPVMVEPAVHQKLFADLRANPAAEVTVDLASQTLTLPDGGKVSFPIEPFAKHCLLNGVDQLGFLIGEEDAIQAYEASRPARVVTSQVA